MEDEHHRTIQRLNESQQDTSQLENSISNIMSQFEDDQRDQEINSLTEAHSSLNQEIMECKARLKETSLQLTESRTLQTQALKEQSLKHQTSSNSLK